MINQTAIFVLGVHRGGTSSVAGCLNVLGVDMGSDLFPPDAELNAKGYWESISAVDIDERLLSCMGRTWQDELPLPSGWLQLDEVKVLQMEIRALIRAEFHDRMIWGVKDPRMCRLLPVWTSVLGETKPLCLLVLRHPVEVAHSLLRRDGIPLERGCLIWIEHMLAAERDSRKHPRLMIAYDGLLSDWRKALEPLQRALGLTQFDDPAVNTAMNSFITPELRHVAALPDAMIPGEIGKLANDLYRVLSRGIESPSSDEFEKLGQRTEELLAPVAPWAQQMQLLLSNIESLELQVDALKKDVANRDGITAELARVKGTVSWRITKPLRGAWNLMHRRAAADKP